MISLLLGQFTFFISASVAIRKSATLGLLRILYTTTPNTVMTVTAMAAW